MKMIIRYKGGAGSGNFGHAGREGHVGGSAPSGGMSGGAFPSLKKNPKLKKYFDKDEGESQSSHSTLHTYTRSNNTTSQTLSVHKDNKSGKFWARVAGGYRGSLNTWSTSDMFDTAEEAISSAVSKAEKFLKPVGEELSSDKYIYPD